MKVTVIVKELNQKFDQSYADKHHDGEESEDNYKYNWEDEFEVNGDVMDFRIHNNSSYKLEGANGQNGFSFDIPSMMIIQAESKNAVSRFAVSRSLIRDTKKNAAKNGDITFYIFLKGGKKIANPFNGVYIAEFDFPKELPIPEEDEITGDEEE